MAKRTPVDPESLPYRPCVGMMVLNREGLVWVGRRIAEPDGEMAGSPQLWQMPQGGIDKGEDPLKAARRELYEETGMESVEPIAEAPQWINYDLPSHLVGIVWKGKYRDEALVNLIKTNPHSPVMYRANGPLRNFDPWYQAYDVKPGDAMYIAPEQRVRIW